MAWTAQRSGKRGHWTVYWKTRSPDGNWSQRSRGGFSTRREAKDYGQEQERLAAGGQIVSVPARLTVRDYLESWLREFASRKGPRTYAGYESLLRVNVYPVIGTVKLRDLRAIHLKRVYSAMRDKRLTERTIEHCHRVLFEALGHAASAEWGLLPRNPTVDLVQPPRGVSQEMQVLTPAELRTVWAAAEETPLTCWVVVAACTGLRKSELHGLNASGPSERWVATNRNACKPKPAGVAPSPGPSGPRPLYSRPHLLKRRAVAPHLTRHSSQPLGPLPVCHRLRFRNRRPVAERVGQRL